MSHDCSKVSGCIQSKTQYLKTEINNKRYLVGCSYWARSFCEVRSCQKWVEARSKPLRRWKEVPNSQQNDAGLLIFYERMEIPQRAFDAEEPEAVIKT